MTLFSGHSFISICVVANLAFGVEVSIGIKTMANENEMKTDR